MYGGLTNHAQGKEIYAEVGVPPAFWVDPKEQMVVVFMTQNQPGAPRRYDRELFRRLVYQALVD